MSIHVIDTQDFPKQSKVRMRFEITGPHKLGLVNEALEALAQNTEIDAESNSLYEGLAAKLGKSAVDEHIASYLSLKAGLPQAKKQGLALLFVPEAVQKEIPQALDNCKAQFDVDFFVRPPFDLSSYEPLYIDEPSSQVTEEAINAQLMREMNRFARYEETDGPVCEGNCVQVNMSTLANGVPEGSLSGDALAIVVSRDLMPAGFVDAVVGMNVGEHKEFQFTHAEGGAAPVHYSVALDVVDKRRRIVPELTDEFVRTRLSQHDKTVAEFRERIRHYLESQSSEADTQRREELATAELGRRLRGAIPDALIERTSRAMYEAIRENATAQGMSLAQFIQMQGMDEKQFQMNVMMQARESLRQGLALDALYQHLGITLTKQDYDNALTELAPGYEEEARKNFQRDNAWFIVEDLAKRQIAQRWLMENSTFA